MNETREFDLLVDLSRLLKKYGPEVFERLSEQLSKPEFVTGLTRLLSGIKRNAPALSVTSRTSKSRQASPSEFRTSLVAFSDVEPEKGALLLWLYDSFMAKTILRNAQALRSFAADTGLGGLETGARHATAIDVIESLRGRPLDKLKTLVADLKTSAEPNDRSLENWSRIIMDDDLRKRKAQ